MKYLRTAFNGIKELVSAIASTAGAADASKIIATNSQGRLDPTFIDTLNTATVNGLLSFDSALAAQSELNYKVAGQTVWKLLKAPNSKNLILQRWDGAGNYVDAPLSVNSATGAITVGSTAITNATVTSATISDLTVTGLASSFDSALATQSELNYKVAGQIAWKLLRAPNSRNLILQRWDGAGNYIDAPFIVSASTGAISLANSTATIGSRTGEIPLTNNATPSDGNILIGNASAGRFDQAAITPGYGASITPAAGSIIIARDATINAVTGAPVTRTLGLSDVDRVITLNHTSDMTLVIPDDATAAIPVGRSITFINQSTKHLFLNASTNTVLYNATIFTPLFVPRNLPVKLLKITANTWLMTAGQIDPLTTWHNYSECLSISEFSTTPSGTGASVGVDTSTARLGVLSLQTGSTASGSASVRVADNAGVTIGSGSGGVGRIYYRGIFRFSVAADAIDSYNGAAGFLDAAASEFTDGFAFRHSVSNSGNLQCVVRSNSTESVYNTSISATAWNTCEVLINDTGTSVLFWINGIQQGPAITSNIPTGSARMFGMNPGRIFKTMGTNNRVMLIDSALYFIDRQVG